MKPLASAIARIALLVPLTVACGAADDDARQPRSWEPEVKASCAAATCASLAKTCGTHDDGCGSTLFCGECVQIACVPKTCKQLEKNCGEQNDGCGGVVDCGICSTCGAENKEPTNAPHKAADLGAMTDYPNSTRNLPDLAIGDGDEDWFKFSVTDSGLGGNPDIEVSATGGVEVSVFYVCTGATNYSTCSNANDVEDNSMGKGCRGKGSSAIATSCTGLTDSGTGYIRIRRLPNSPADKCITYTLDVKVG